MNIFTSRIVSKKALSVVQQNIVNPKSQNTNIKQIPMTKIRNPKLVLVIEYLNLKFICNLVLVIWDFKLPFYRSRNDCPKPYLCN